MTVAVGPHPDRRRHGDRRSRPTDDAFTATIPVDKDGFYRVELQGGPRASSSTPRRSTRSTCSKTRRRPCRFAKPGRDTTASPIEEFAIEARADDDFGVRQLELVYSVNGGPEKTKKLFDGPASALPEVSAGHTFYLEELKRRSRATPCRTSRARPTTS